MDIFTNQKIWKKIVIALLIVLSFQFIICSPVRAGDDDGGIGGKLMKPVIDLIVYLGDGIIGFIHDYVMDQDQTLIYVDMTEEWWQTLLKIVIIVGAAIAAVIATIVSAGGFAAIAAMSTGMMLLTVAQMVGAGIAGAVFGSYFSEVLIPDEDFEFPMYSISTEEIFKGDIMLFDVDFFNPKEVYVELQDGAISKYNLTDEAKNKKNGYGNVSDEAYKAWVIFNNQIYEYVKSGKEVPNYIPGSSTMGSVELLYRYDEKKDDKEKLREYCYYTLKHFYEKGTKADVSDNSLITAYKNLVDLEPMWGDIFYKDPPPYPYNYLVDGKTLVKEKGENEKYRPSDIGENELANSAERYYYIDDNGERITTSMQNTASELRVGISRWYNSLRGISLVLMMSVLLYIGIRMMISSVAADKAKYKQMLTDWFVAMCLIIFLHYIMAFSVTLTKQFTKVIKSITDPVKYSVTIDSNDDIKKALEKAGQSQAIQKSGDKEVAVWVTNLMGKVRMESQMKTGVTSIGYSICFVILVFYTVYFSFVYLKRVVYLAFLTIISPLVALTYPIDKVHDGQAQAFNKWFKEYIFNLLIQPLHLLLYTMLISSAIDFASKNLWYALVAIGFMMPAEKLLRSFFGFEKASTPGSLAGAAVGAGLVSSGIGKISNIIPGGNKKERISGGNNTSGGKGSKALRTRLNRGGMSKSNSITALYSGEKDNNGLKYANDNKSFSKSNSFGNSNNMKIEAKKPGQNVNISGNNRLIINGKRQLSNTNSNNNLPKRKRLKKSVKKVGKKVFSPANGRRLTNLAGKGIRFAAGATLAGVAGTIGVAAGIASGDPSNILTYGTAGVAAGAKAGSKAAGTLQNATGTAAGALKDKIEESNIRNQKRFLGEDVYEEKQMQKQIREWKDNAENRKAIEDRVGLQEADEMFDSGEIEQYIRNDVTNTEDMVAMHQLQKEKVVDNVDQAIVIKEYADKIGDTTKMKSKDKKEWKSTLKDEFKQKGFKEEQSELLSKNAFDKVDSYNNIKTKL